MIATASDKENVPPVVHAEAVTEVVRQIFQQAFSEDNTDQTVDVANQLRTRTADVLTNDQFAVKDVLKVLHHDYATLTHSASVALYCGILANELGYSHEIVQYIGIIKD